MIHNYRELDWRERQALEEKAQKKPVAMVEVEKPNHNNGGYGHIHVTFVWLHPSDDKPRSFRDTSPLDNLTIRSQASAGLSEGRLYGWGFAYADEYHVDLERAETMIKMLRKIRRAMDKANEQSGRCADFASWVSRICQILKVKSAIRKTGGSGHMYSENHYQTGNIGDLVSWIRWDEQTIKETFT